MTRRSTNFGIVLVAAILLPTTVATAAATVNYQGYLYGEFGSPAYGGFIIAGTFAPGFNPETIACVYGDESCNVGTEYYTLGVNDGTIRPIGDGVTTDSNGFFSGTGTTSEIAGSPIYLFGFPPFSSAEGVVATSNHPSFLVPPTDGSTTLDASLANSFVFGYQTGNGIAVAVLPFPEPSALALVVIALGAWIAFWRR